MKAMVIESFGGPEVFKEAEIPIPKIEPGHVLIKVKATAVNPLERKIRSGLVKSLAPKFPAVLNGDVAGVVQEVARDVQEFKVGDEVYGLAGGVKGTKGGALAEYLLCDRRLIAKKPKKATMEEAAALPIIALTAWIGLFDKADLWEKEHILIHGGTGGVGHIAVQLAKWCNAKVVCTVGKEEDVSIAKSLGAEYVLNYKKDMPAEYMERLTKGKGFDVVFDTPGGDNLKNSFDVVGLDGRVVTTNARVEMDLFPMHHKGLSLHAVFCIIPAAFHVNMEVQAENLRKIAELVDEGHLKPRLHPETFYISEVAKAHELLDSGNAKGKIVLKI